MVFMLPFTMKFKIFVNMFAFLYQRRILWKSVKKSFPSFFRKLLMSAVLLGFKANYLEKMATLCGFQ